MHRSVGPMTIGVMALASMAWAQDLPGRQIFEDRCGACHGADGNGGEILDFRISDGGGREQ